MFELLAGRESLRNCERHKNASPLSSKRWVS